MECMHSSDQVVSYMFHSCLIIALAQDMDIEDLTKYGHIRKIGQTLRAREFSTHKKHMGINLLDFKNDRN